MIIAVLQARASSTRLPGKVLKPILGRPMLARQIERLKRSSLISRLILATSTDNADNEVARIARLTGIGCYRGSLEDVLDRFYNAVLPYQPELVVRLTGDCPLTDWNIIDRAVAFARSGDFDYVSNTLTRTWPKGLDVEVFKPGALETAWHEARDPFEREHVTPFIYGHSDQFRLGDFVNDADLGELRWTVDHPEDFLFVDRIYNELYLSKPDFGTADVLALLAKQPDIARLNDHIST
jgi:spore coat polysaccharide biosynthesis protein SpsF